MGKDLSGFYFEFDQRKAAGYEIVKEEHFSFVI